MSYYSSHHPHGHQPASSSSSTSPMPSPTNANNNHRARNKVSSGPRTASPSSFEERDLSPTSSAYHSAAGSDLDVGPQQHHDLDEYSTASGSGSQRGSRTMPAGSSSGRFGSSPSPRSRSRHLQLPPSTSTIQQPREQRTPMPMASTSALSSSHTDEELFVTCHPPDEQPSFVFVCLGVGGGPLENDCSCYMVKPAGRDWRQGSFVLEGGSWLGALSKLCEPDTMSPAFLDFPFSHKSPSIRAGEIGSHAKAFLITHAHLDHILGMVLGSASLPGKRAVYGLKSTLDNLLGIFDGKLWPKLASLDENAPFIVYHCRPIECQKTIHLDDDISVLPFALSHGLNMSTVPEPPTPQPQPLSASCYFSKRYSLPLNSLMSSAPPLPTTTFLEPPGGGGVKPNFSSPFAPDRKSNAAGTTNFYNLSSGTGGMHDIQMERSNSSSAASSPRVPSHEEFDAGQTPSMSSTPGSSTFGGESQRDESRSSSKPSLPRAFLGKGRRPKTASGSEKANPPLSDLQPTTEDASNNKMADQKKTKGEGRPKKVDISSPGDDGCSNGSSGHHHNSSGGGATMDSTAFFLTNKQTDRQVLFFGDVEPDCVSRSPRNRRVWQHTAMLFASNRLNTVFLECSFPAAQPTEFLWGHLSTSHLYDELKVLARCVKSERAVLARTKGCSSSASGLGNTSAPARMVNFSKPILKEPLPVIPPSPLVPTSQSAMAGLKGVLSGLTVIIIHAKQAFFPSYSDEKDDTSSTTASEEDTSNSGSRKGSRVLDPRTMQERILQELEEVEEENGLGVRFVMSRQGMRIEI
ncbi:unnamed protein product [Sympodiomycopsis kandeliae]